MDVRSKKNAPNVLTIRSGKRLDTQPYRAVTLAEAKDLEQWQANVVAGCFSRMAMPERNTIMPKTQTRVINRSSETGRLVTASFAKAHPKTTETQHVRVPVSTPLKKGK